MLGTNTSDPVRHQSSPPCSPVGRRLLPKNQSTRSKLAAIRCTIKNLSESPYARTKLRASLVIDQRHKLAEEFLRQIWAVEDLSRQIRRGTHGAIIHALRHTYASLCLAAGIDPLRLSGFMGHSKVTTTLGVYAHLFVDDHAETMAALEAMSRPVAPNVVPIRGRR